MPWRQRCDRRHGDSLSPSRVRSSVGVMSRRADGCLRLQHEGREDKGLRASHLPLRLQSPMAFARRWPSVACIRTARRQRSVLRRTPTVDRFRHLPAQPQRPQMLSRSRRSRISAADSLPRLPDPIWQLTDSLPRLPEPIWQLSDSLPRLPEPIWQRKESSNDYDDGKSHQCEEPNHGVQRGVFRMSDHDKEENNGNYGDQRVDDEPDHEALIRLKPSLPQGPPLEDERLSLPSCLDWLG
jgi:hypothetical protein